MTKIEYVFSIKGKFDPNFEFTRSILKTYSICCYLNELFRHHLNGIMFKRHKHDKLATFHTMGKITVLAWEGPFNYMQTFDSLEHFAEFH